MINRQSQLGFAPYDDCKTMLLNLASSATKKIRIADYSFNMDELVDVLINKFHQGLDICLVLDKSQSGGATEKEPISRLKASQIPYVVGTSDKHKIMHLKVIIVDDAVVGSGSYNFTEVAEQESNFFRVDNDPEIAKAFTNDWEMTYQWIKVHDAQP